MSRTTAFDVSAHGAERAEKEALRLLPLCQESSETVSSCGDAEEVSFLKVALIHHLLVGPKRVDLSGELALVTSGLVLVD